MRQVSMSWRGRVWVLCTALVLAGCLTDEEVLAPPTPVDAIFARYVAFGNSVTAGFQSGGINDSTQQRAYPVLVAKQMQSVFTVPSLNMPGCPPPIVNIYVQSRIDTIPNDCAFREGLTPSAPFISNLAVPAAAVFDVFGNDLPDAQPNPLTTFILGGRTQVDAARAASPTFATVWIGNSDALSAATSASNPGDPALVTPPGVFAARYAAMLDSLDTIATLRGGLLIGVLHVVFAPFFTQGRVWEGVEQQLDAATAPFGFNAFDVGPACLDNLPIPGSTEMAWAAVPFPVGMPRLALAQARIDSVIAGQLAPGNVVTVTLDCTDAEAMTAAEVLNLIGAVTAYNATIAAAAQARGWPFLDPNDLLEQVSQVPGAILTFPALPPTPESVTAPFGTALSRDGIHPSTLAHQLVADAIIDAINAHYSTSIPNLQ